MSYDVSKIKHALEQATWSEVKRYFLDKLLELKNQTPEKSLSAEDYKTTDLGVKLAYQKLHEILTELTEWSQEEIGKTEKDKEKDSLTSTPKKFK